MAVDGRTSEDREHLNQGTSSTSVRRGYSSSESSISSTSFELQNLNKTSRQSNGKLVKSLDEQNNGHVLGYRDKVDDDEDAGSEMDLEGMPLRAQVARPIERRARRLIWVFGTVAVTGWALAFVLLLWNQAYKHASAIPYDPAATSSRGSGKEITLESVLTGTWIGTKHHISWIADPDGEDGLLLEKDSGDENYVVVKDIRERSARDGEKVKGQQTLMKDSKFKVDDEELEAKDVWPSPDLKKVLVITDKEKNWRHSYTGRYWIVDVASQTAEALDPANPDGDVQLATWSPKSDSIVFTRDNDLFIRKLSSKDVTQITKDGGPDIFNGVPDWVYEEEVFSGNSATWWSEDGGHVAFLRSNDTTVPEYGVQYFVKRPSQTTPPSGEENYPETREIKYPKAGAPNPVVNLQFYDVSKDETYSVDIVDDFADDDRLITEVIWAGASKALVKETNRESDILRVVLVDVKERSGKVVRTVDVNALDKGWFEVSQNTFYVPADVSKGRSKDGYIDTVIHKGYDHLAYFSPLDSSDPKLLTSGSWEVVDAPSAVDLKNNVVYFIGTRESPIQRTVYSVGLHGGEIQAVTDISQDGYYGASFSKGTGYYLLSYDGPNVPWQKVLSTPSSDNQFENIVEHNEELKGLAARHEFPILVYSTVKIDGFTLQVVERRPPHFDEKRKYPVLFQLYGGPGSQTVEKKWNVNFQFYVASALGYIVVTVDGRGTGFMGRKTRCIIRGNIGYYEAHDQIETAKKWAAKKYVDEERIAIWGWSYGGFLTLKTLELDEGRTFKYGMAVAPVTDWRYYDSIYTERYMQTPQHNPAGYTTSSISNGTAIGGNVRFLIMHGVADDNVHLQNTLTLLDKLDVESVENYDVHVFPDSDHSIYFHNANRMVYNRLSNWLVNAFNGEWLRTPDAVPKHRIDAKAKQ